MSARSRPHLGHRNAPLQIHSRRRFRPRRRMYQRLRGSARPPPRRRHDQRGADGDAAIGDGRFRQLGADIAVEPDGFGEHQAATAAQPPAVDEFAMRHPLAHRRAAEHHDFAEQKPRILRQIDIDAAQDPRPVEQDGLLRQPPSRAPASAFSAMLSWAEATGTIDLLGCGRCQRQRGALAGHDIDVETVAAGDAAGRVDEHARQAVSLGRGKPHAQRARFMHYAAPGYAVLALDVEFDRALGPVGRECGRCRARGFGPHPSPKPRRDDL